MHDYESKVLEENVGPDKGKTIIAELTRPKGTKPEKFRVMYKVWLPEQSIEKDPSSFFSANFLNFSQYLKGKYGDFEVTPDAGLKFFEEFPLHLIEHRRYGMNIGLSLFKNGKRFGHAVVNNWEVGHNLSPEEEQILWQRLWEEQKGNSEKRHELFGEKCFVKVCSVFKEFTYVPDLKPEIPDSDFFKIMKHEIMNHTEIVNYKSNIRKRVVLNEEEFIAALDLWVNSDKKRENEHWRTEWRGDDILSKHNEKRVYDLFLWDFWAGWDHGTKMTAYSCNNCADNNVCRKQEVPRSAYPANTRNGTYTYEPLGITIPFP